MEVFIAVVDEKPVLWLKPVPFTGMNEIP